MCDLEKNDIVQGANQFTNLPITYRGKLKITHDPINK